VLLGAVGVASSCPLLATQQLIDETGSSNNTGDDDGGAAAAATTTQQQHCNQQHQQSGRRRRYDGLSSVGNATRCAATVSALETISAKYLFIWEVLQTS